MQILQTKADIPAADIFAADTRHLLVVLGSSVGHIAAVVVLALAHAPAGLVELALVAEDMNSDAEQDMSSGVEPPGQGMSSDAEPAEEDMGFVAVSGQSCLSEALAGYTQSGDRDQ